MTVRLEWRTYVNAFIHVRLCKFFSGSGYYALQQPIGKAGIPISKIQVRLQEWKTTMYGKKLFWCSVTVLMKKYQQVVLRFGSCISIKITSFCLLSTKLKMGLERRGVAERRHKKHLPSKGVPNQFRGAEQYAQNEFFVKRRKFSLS